MDTKPVINKVDEFGDLLKKGMEYIKKACEVYVQAITEDPNLLEEFKTKYPEVSMSAWADIEAVGRGTLSQGLLFKASSGYNRLKKLPLSLQQKYINGTVELLIEGGESLKVKVEALTTDQARQVFSRTHVRTLGEQRAYLESKRSKNKLKPYKIIDKKLVVKRVEFTIEELEDILKELRLS